MGRDIYRVVQINGGKVVFKCTGCGKEHVRNAIGWDYRNRVQMPEGWGCYRIFYWTYMFCSEIGCQEVFKWWLGREGVKNG